MYDTFTKVNPYLRRQPMYIMISGSKVIKYVCFARYIKMSFPEALPYDSFVNDCIESNTFPQSSLVASEDIHGLQ